MQADQQPLGSGYGRTSTTDDVLQGVDLTGRLAVVTGGYSGLGLETTRALSRAGAVVVVPARRPDLAAQAVRDLERVEVAAMDLGDLRSVRSFAEWFLATSRGVDLLIGNAGIMAAPETRVGPGWESHLAVNHLGHYALVNLLWPAVSDGGGRVVSVSSNGHQISDVHWDDVHFRQGYDKWQAYGQAKSANALFAVHLDALGADHGVRAYSLHPGVISTSLARHIPREEMLANGWLNSDGSRPETAQFKSPAQGAATQVWAATSPLLEGRGGVYCEDCDIAPVVKPNASGQLTSGVYARAVDPDRAARLWALSAKLTNLDLVLA